MNSESQKAKRRGWGRGSAGRGKIDTLLRGYS